MFGWLIVFIALIAIAVICFLIDLCTQGKYIKRYGYSISTWYTMVFIGCVVFAVIALLLAIVVPIEATHIIEDLTSILAADPTNDVAIAELIEHKNNIDRYGCFADLWTQKDELYKLIEVYICQK